MKKFFTYFLASLLAMMVFGFLVFAIVAAAFSGEKKPTVPEKAVLTLDLSTPISDKPSSQELSDLLSDVMEDRDSETVTLRTILDSIDEAAGDERIQGIYVKGRVSGQGYFSGWAALKEVRHALEKFKESGKPVIAYGTDMNEADLYLASAADKLYLNPFGTIELNGFAAEIMFFKSAFEKYGIEVQVTRVGKYKSAVEPFILDEMSEANREQIELLLNGLFDEALEAIARARNKDVAAVRTLAETIGFLEPKDALEQGYVDQLVYFDHVLGELRSMTGAKAGEKFKNEICVADYHRAVVAKKEDVTDGIAVIYAEGEIVDGVDEREVGGDALAKLLRKAREDDKIKAVVMRVNSPGGSASASEVIQRETRLLKEKKPFIVSMGTVAASGGYWISSYADQIFAEPNTITGSIGVFGMLPSVQGLLNTHGIHVDVAKTAPFADIMTLYRPKNEAELALIQKLVNFIYDEFLSKVAEGRNLDRAHVEEIAQGRVWSGSEAKKLGLVDVLGGLREAIAAAAEKANLGSQYQIVQYQEKKEFMDEILEQLGLESKPDSRSDQVGQVVRDVRHGLHLLSQFNDPRGVYVRLPYDLTVQ